MWCNKCGACVARALVMEVALDDGRPSMPMGVSGAWLSGENQRSSLIGRTCVSLRVRLSAPGHKTVTMRCSTLLHHRTKPSMHHDDLVTPH